MIYYLTAQNHAFMMQNFLDSWGTALSERISIVPYERIFSGEPVHLSAGTYIFTSLGNVMGSRNPPSRARQLASDLHRRLAEAYGPARVLNDPSLSMSRFDVLQALHKRGINRFAAHRVGGSGAPQRYPVLLRPEGGSLWKTPPLVRTREEYDAAVGHTNASKGLLAIEFCDTADTAGVYRKYGCFIVGERIVPRHVFFSRNWLVKQADLCEPAMIEEELKFLESMPHAQALREAARIAHITYGRVDYSLLNGQPQVWEINMAAMIASASASEIPARRPAQLRFVELFRAALDAIDPPAA